MEKTIRAVVLSLFSAFAVFVRLDLYANFSSLVNSNFVSFSRINELAMGISSVVLFFAYKKNAGTSVSGLKVFLSVLFAVFMLLGELLVSFGHIFKAYSNSAMLPVSAIKIAGYSGLFILLFKYLDRLICNQRDTIRAGIGSDNWYFSLLRTHPFRTSFVSLFIAYLVYMISFYPVILPPDPSDQIVQYLNFPNEYVNWVEQVDPNVFLTAHHPVFHTYLIGWALSVGRALGSDNLGLFLFSLFQSVIYIGAFAYSVKMVIDSGINEKAALMLLLMYAFVPMYGLYSVTAVKDTLYTSFILIFALLLYDLLKNHKSNKIGAAKTVLLFLSGLLMCLIRHNGVYVIIASIPFMLVILKPHRIRILLTMASVLLVYFSFNNIVIPALHISPGSIRETLSLPFQMTARYVKYYDDEVTDEERQIIDKLLNYETLAERYNPNLADPVKAEFNKNTTNEDLKQYFRVWLRQGIKHPSAYVEAALEGNCGYFYPDKHKWYIYYREYDTVRTEADVDYHYIKGLEPLRELIMIYGKGFPHIPLVGLLANIAINVWWVLILSSYLIEKKKYRLLLVMIPLYVSVLVCFVSPANTYFRYAMPYVFLNPCLSILLIHEIRNDASERGSEKAEIAVSPKTDTESGM